MEEKPVLDLNAIVSMAAAPWTLRVLRYVAEHGRETLTVDDLVRKVEAKFVSNQRVSASSTTIRRDLTLLVDGDVVTINKGIVKLTDGGRVLADDLTPVSTA